MTSLPAVEPVQRRTLRLLFGTQILGGIGTTIGVAVGGLLAAQIGGTNVSGLAASAQTVGGALLAVPVVRLMRARGRRPGLAAAYLTGAGGAALVYASAATGRLWLLMLGMLMFGGGTAANLQARYTAVDLSPADRRGRQLSIIVWATTIGAVVAPNFADPADTFVRKLGAPAYGGPFVVSVAVFTLAAIVLTVRLRPDPLLLSRALAAAADAPAADGSAAGDGAAADGSAVGGGAAVGSVAAGERRGAPGSAADGSVAGAAAADGSAAVGSATAADGSAVAGSATAADRSAVARVIAAAPGVAGGTSRPQGATMREARRVVLATPAARLAIAAVATGHLVMVGVMSMTPVHIGTMPGMDHGDVLRLVGIVLSVHVAGMYALSPVVGLAADRLGRRPVILAGVGVLLAACLLAGTSGESRVRLTGGLVLLGFGWSCMIVAGSTLLTESVGLDVRPAAQGLSDLVMGIAGASSAAVSGLIVSGPGYPTLTLLAALATVPLLALALRTSVPGPRSGAGAGLASAAAPVRSVAVEEG